MFKTLFSYLPVLIGPFVFILVPIVIRSGFGFYIGLPISLAVTYLVSFSISKDHKRSFVVAAIDLLLIAVLWFFLQGITD